MASRRELLLARAAGQRADVLIVGGGIVGGGIARDAALRGLKVALIEQGDFGSGTSSKTSKLIHGGLRYLEHGHLRLVFESLRERHVLRTIAPGLVRSLSLVLPIYQGDRRPVWKIRAGLWLYDLLAAGRRIRPHRMLSPQRALELEPALRRDGLRGAGLYADCQMDDARLCLANILQAASFGAACCNYVRLREFLTANGHICGGAVEDVLSGRTFEIRAPVVVNATGPWADGVRRLAEPDALPRLAPSKGIHLIVPRIAQAALFAQARDGRMIFFLPWGEYSLVGTTETPVGEPLDVLRAKADEVGYLLEEVNRVLPGSHLGEDDVVATFAGARPLLASSGSADQASREHRIEVNRSGLVSIMGGKFTTYRRMAQEVVEWIVRQGRRRRADRCLTDQVSLLEAVQPATLRDWHALTRTIDPDLLTRLLVRYGSGTFHILRLLDQDPSLGRPVCPHHDYLEAELAHAWQKELACTITDVLARRTRIAWSSCQGLDALSRITELARRYGGHSRVRVEQQVEEYQYVLAMSLAFRRPSARSVAAT